MLVLALSGSCRCSWSSCRFVPHLPASARGTLAPQCLSPSYCRTSWQTSLAFFVFHLYQCLQLCHLLSCLFNLHVSEAKLPGLFLVFIFHLLKYRYCFLSSHHLMIAWPDRLIEKSTSRVCFYSLIVVFNHPSPCPFFHCFEFVCLSDTKEWINSLGVSAFVLPLLLLWYLLLLCTHSAIHPAFIPVLIVTLENWSEVFSLYLQANLLW